MGRRFHMQFRIPSEDRNMQIDFLWDGSMPFQKMAGVCWFSIIQSWKDAVFRSVTTELQIPWNPN